MHKSNQIDQKFNILLRSPRQESSSMEQMKPSNTSLSHLKYLALTQEDGFKDLCKISGLCLAFLWLMK